MVSATFRKESLNLILQKIRLPLGAFDLEIDIEIQSMVTAIFGISGSGKTSLLDLIAGLRKEKLGRIKLNNEILSDTDDGSWVSPQRRRIVMCRRIWPYFPIFRFKITFSMDAKLNEMIRICFLLDTW